MIPSIIDDSPLVSSRHNHIAMKPDIKYPLFLTAVAVAALTVTAQDRSKNYVERTVAAQSASSTFYKGVRSVTYFDGLGRDVSTLTGSVGDNAAPVATFTSYDDRGNISESWLPVGLPDWRLPSPDADGTYSSLYGVNTYSTTVFKYSAEPSTRPTLTRMPGSAQAAGPGRRTEHLISGTGELAYRSMSLTADGSLRYDGGDGGRKMRVVKSTDEEKRVIYRFYDSLDSLVLERRVGDDGRQADTHWVRDLLGRVRFILSPLGSEQTYSEVGTGGGDVPSRIVDTFCHVYDYDDQGRLIRTKRPQTGPVDIAYDAHWRPVLTQDAKMLASGRALVTAFDHFHRPTVTAFLPTARDGAALRDSVKNFHADSNFTGSGQFFGYQVPWGNRVVPDSALTVTFYDDYAWLDALPDSVTRDALAYDDDQEFGSKSFSKTRVTGRAVRVLGSDKWTYEAVYYDHRGHECQRRSTDHLGGLTVTKWLRMTDGSPLRRLVSRYDRISNRENPLAMITDWEYDDMGRETSCVMTVGARKIDIAANTYDNLGRLSRVARSETLNEDFKYDLRSRLTTHRAEVSFGTRFNRMSLLERISYDLTTLDGNPSNHFVSEHREGRTSPTSRHFDDFNYDGFNRLASVRRTRQHISQNFASRDTVYEDYSTAYAYDLNSSTTRVTRQSASETVDNLTIRVDGNRPVKVYDDSDIPSASDEAFFEDGADKAVELAYDVNGNLVCDLNRHIERIEYNYLNLPERVVFTTGDSLVYVYDAAGRRLGDRHFFNPDKLTSADVLLKSAPFSGDVELTDGTPPKVSKVKRLSSTDRVGDLTFQSRRVRRIDIPGGFILTDSNGIPKSHDVYRFVTDYRGSVMAVANDSTGFVEARNYYPYGLPHELPKVDKRAFEGKEMETAARLHWLDYGPRRYDPATTFWTSPDPLSAIRPDVSPYAYCAANPAANIDPSGYRIVTNFNGIEYDLQLTDGDKYAFFDAFGDRYVPEESIASLCIDTLIDDLNIIGEGKFGSGLLNYLISNSESVSIEAKYGSGNDISEYRLNNNSILWYANIGQPDLLSHPRGGSSSSYLGLGHELAHAADKLTGKMDKSWISRSGARFPTCENFAVLAENMLRYEHNFPRRFFYEYSTLNKNKIPNFNSYLNFCINDFEKIELILKYAK